MLPFARTGLAAVTALCLMAGWAKAEVITENLALPEDAQGIPATGQSVTTPSDGPWNQITFNFYEGYAGDPFATGGLFLLGQEYLGLHTALSPSTPGYIAQSNDIQVEDGGSEWTFAADLTLQPDTQYWFYMDGLPGALLGYNGAAYSGGDLYYATSSAPYMFAGPSDARFQLEGVPEPSTLVALAGLLGMGLLGYWRRRKIS